MYILFFIDQLCFAFFKKGPEIRPLTTLKVDLREGTSKWMGS